MRRIVLSLLLGAVAMSTASAADLSIAPVYKAPVAVPPAFTWTGFYVGGYGGGGWGSEDPVDINEYAGQTITNGTGHIWRYNTGSSFIGGGTIGFNYQWGNIVLGLEGEAGYVHLSGSGADPRSPGLDVISSSQLGDWYGIAAGRIGYAWDRVLLYGKAGVVFTSVNANISDTCKALPCGPVTISASGSKDNVASLAVGGGLEYALTNNWSIKGEYIYWSLNNHFLVTGVASNNASYSWDHSFSGLHTLKLGVNYRF
jgi:outer membrane immunogenic protein